MSVLSSILGMVVLIAIAVLLSNNRKAISIRTVVGALAIQVGFAALILYVPAGKQALGAAADMVSNVIAYGNDGINFVFGGLADPSKPSGFIFAVKVLPIIVFFSGLISVLYYLGIMQVVIKVLGGALQKALGTSKAESMSAAANIFVGQTEAPLVVRPYIKNMTQSELFAIMVGGTASIAGSVMAGYAGMGVPLTYLIAASFMAAPAGLFAKLMFPQTEQFTDKQPEDNDSEKPTNVLEAMAGGASAGMQLALNVGAMLIAFVGLIALINGILSGVGGWFGYGDLTLQSIFGLIFKPLAYLIGVTDGAEAGIAGQMIGMKLAVNEFVGYLEFAKYLQPDSAIVLTEKTKAIITFALCGFANFSSIAILIGGLGGMAPSRRSDVARLGIKAVIAGTLANLMSATIAGLFIGLGAAAL
ncbi:TPA: NupC/NupG family nucleoside CNT transporter [Haemophilus influenzae]